ncbi:hypothetical protein GO594_09090 [Pseudomonas otitidis]|uniref:Uncharacterized protein n=1 Tax=Metapseudomonas otitidis TaxID=319939 RepID=A0A7X3H7U2_9GAMM|nr:hypothetical protein [Pseudomonas otitidis]
MLPIHSSRAPSGSPWPWPPPGPGPQLPQPWPPGPGPPGPPGPGGPASTWVDRPSATSARTRVRFTDIAHLIAGQPHTAATGELFAAPGRYAVSAV